MKDMRLHPEKLNYIVSKSTELENLVMKLDGAPILENIEYADGGAIVGEDEIDGMDRFIEKIGKKIGKLLEI